MAENELMNNYWWADKGNVNETLFGIIRFLEQNQNYIRAQNLRNLRLYGNLNTLGLSPHSYAQTQTVNAPYDRVTLNIIQSMCDTVTNKIAKNKVKVSFLTEGGDFTLQRKAKLLEKFIQGQFYATNFYDIAPRVFLDSCIFGTGVMKIFECDGDIKCERVFIDEIACDQAEVIYGEPRNLYQTKTMPKELVARLWPQYKSKIMEAPRVEQTSPAHDSLSNPICVLEAWHLPAGKGEDKKGGRHVICIENQILLDEDWKKDYFPFVFMRWTQRPLGFFGQGLSEQLTGLQVEINKILRTIQLSFHLLSAPGVLIEKGSQIVRAHLNNEVGRIIEFQGVKPELWTQNPVAAQLFEHLERLYARSYEIAGISMLAAQSKKPAGLDSGKALREFNDIESERFMLIGQRWEQFHLDTAKQMITLATEIYTEDKDYSVKVKGKKFLEKIKWADIDLEEDEYMMQVFPISYLSSTPSGRLQDIQDLAQIGEFDKRQLVKLLDFPDLEAHVSLATAAIDDIENTIEKFLDKGEYTNPEPFQDLQYGIQVMQSAYLKAKNDNVPEEKLELFRQWMAEADQIAKEIAAAQQPQVPQGMPAGQPTATPTAPPQSPLLPNVPGVA